jgi:glucose/mannose transport system substrate-binding protein
MGRLSSAVFGATALLAVVATPSSAAGLKAEVIHWWTSGDEAAAVKVFADAYDKNGGQWIDSAIAGGGGEAARTAGINRIVGGNPPTMMQFNTGKQLDELVNNGYLANLDDTAKAGGWEKVLPKPISEASIRDGHWYALPVNIHGVNWLFYNTKVFADAGVAEPKTWSDVLASGPNLKAKRGNSLRARRPGLAGSHPVRCGARRRGRFRALPRRLWQGRAEGDRNSRLQACRGRLQAAPRTDGFGYARRQLE